MANVFEDMAGVKSIPPEEQNIFQLMQSGQKVDQYQKTLDSKIAQMGGRPRTAVDVVTDIASKAGEKIAGGLSAIAGAATTPADPQQGLLDRAKQIGLGAVGGATGGLYEPGDRPQTEARQAQRILGAGLGGILPSGLAIKGLGLLGLGAKTAGVVGTTAVAAGPDLVRGKPEEAASSALANLGMAGGFEAGKTLSAKLISRTPAGKALTNQEIGQTLRKEARNLGPAEPSESYYKQLDADASPVRLQNSRPLADQLINMAAGDPMMADVASAINRIMPRNSNSTPVHNISEMNRILNGAEYALGKAGKGKQAETLRMFQEQIINDLRTANPQQADNLHMATWSFKRELGSKKLEDLVTGKPIVGRSGQPVVIKDFEKSLQDMEKGKTAASLDRWLSPREVGEFKKLVVDAGRSRPPTDLRGGMTGSPFREITPIAIPAWYLLRDSVPYANLMGILYLTAKVADRAGNSVKFAQMAKDILDNPRSYALSGAVGNAILQANQSGQSAALPGQPVVK